MGFLSKLNPFRPKRLLKAVEKPFRTGATQQVRQAEAQAQEQVRQQEETQRVEEEKARKRREQALRVGLSDRPSLFAMLGSSQDEQRGTLG